MPNKDGTANVGDALKSIGIALVFAVLIVWAGSSLRHNWLVIIVTPACTVAGAYLAMKASAKKPKLETMIAWGALGLIAGAIWFFTS